MKNHSLKQSAYLSIWAISGWFMLTQASKVHFKFGIVFSSILILIGSIAFGNLLYLMFIKKEKDV